MVSDIWILSSSPRVSDGSKQWVWSNRLYAGGSALFLSLKRKLLSKQGLLCSWTEIRNMWLRPCYLCCLLLVEGRPEFFFFPIILNARVIDARCQKNIWDLPIHLLFLWDCNAVPPIPTVWLQCFPYAQEGDGPLAASSPDPILPGNLTAFHLPSIL